MARILLPKSAFYDSLELLFENPTTAAVTIDGYAAVLAGQTGNRVTHRQLQQRSNPSGTREQVGTEGSETRLVRFTQPATPEVGQWSPLTLPAKSIGMVELSLPRTKIAPDSYAGHLYLNIKDAESKIKVPVTMNIRTGPLWPLLFLLAGIGLGRLVSYMQKRGGPTSDAMAAIDAVESLVTQAHPDDAKIVRSTLKRIRQLVYQEKLEKIKELLAGVEATLDALSRLRELEEMLRGKEQHPQASEALKKIARARNYLAAGSFEKASPLIGEIVELVAGLKEALVGAGETSEMVERLPSVVYTVKGSFELAAASPTPEKRTLGQRLIDAFGYLSGHADSIRAEATYHLARPLLSVVLFVALLAVGCQTLYLEKGASFGANPFADYLSLLFWGMSADVTSRSLTTLKGTQS